MDLEARLETENSRILSSPKGLRNVHTRIKDYDVNSLEKDVSYLAVHFHTPSLSEISPLVDQLEVIVTDYEQIISAYEKIETSLSGAKEKISHMKQVLSEYDLALPNVAKAAWREIKHTCIKNISEVEYNWANQFLYSVDSIKDSLFFRRDSKIKKAKQIVHLYEPTKETEEVEEDVTESFTAEVIEPVIEDKMDYRINTETETTSVEKVYPSSQRFLQLGLILDGGGSKRGDYDRLDELQNYFSVLSIKSADDAEYVKHLHDRIKNTYLNGKLSKKTALSSRNSMLVHDVLGMLTEAFTQSDYA